jgi:rhodanese-related sulfurtransferase
MDHSPGFLRLVDAVRDRVRAVSVEEALARQEAGARLLDVREDGEWAAGHAVGAEHIGRGVLERDIERLAPDPDAELLVYCGGGYRSVLAVDTLQRMGYRNVASVDGGWRAWEGAGAPVHRPGAPSAAPAAPAPGARR